MSDQEYYKNMLAKLQQSKYVNPYDLSEATPPPTSVPNMSVAPPVAPPPTTASNMPPTDPVEQASAGVVAPATGSRTYGAGPANPGSPYFVPHTAINPVDMVNNSNENIAGLTNDHDKHLADKMDAMTDVAMGQSAGADEASKIYTDQANSLAASNAHDRAAQIMHQQDAQKLFKENQSISQEMSDFYQRQPKDLWGRAGVNKVSGIIGLFMGALSRDGHNPAMDALNTLVDQNLTQQKFNYQMLGDKVKMNDNLYARLRDKLGDDRAAELSARQVYTQEALSRLHAVEQNTISKTGKANLAAGIAELQAKNDEYKLQLNEHYFTQTAKAAELGLTQRGQDLTHAEHVETINAAKQGQQGLPGEINGMTAPENPGLRLSKGQTDVVRAQQQGVAKIGLAVDNIKTTLKSNKWSDDVLKSKLEADLKVAMIEADNLSKRVGASEGELITQKAGALAVGYAGFFAKKVSRNELIRMFDNLHRESERAFTGGLVANGYTVTKGGMYDRSSTASDSGQSDDEIVQSMQTRGSKPTQLPEFNQ